VFVVDNFIIAVVVVDQDRVCMGGGGGGSKIGVGDMERDSGDRRYAEETRSVRPRERMIELTR
jgi:hypothetical protein